MKICARCDTRMKDAEAQPVDVTSPSGAGMTIYVHRELCKRRPQQTTRSTPWR